MPRVEARRPERKRESSRPATLDEPEHDDHDHDEEEQVNEISTDVEGHPTSPTEEKNEHDDDQEEVGHGRRESKR